MGLETANTAPLGRIDPSSLIGLASPVVNPSATAALSDAFRSGMVTANDVLDRVGEHARKKKELDIAGYQNQLNQLQDPALAAAQHQALVTAGAQGQLGAAQAGAALPLVGPQADLAQQKIEQEQANLKYPAAQLFDLYAPKMGLSVPIGPDGKVDYAQKAKIGSQIASWQTDRTEAKDKLSNIDTHLSADGTILTAVTKQGQPVSPEEVSKLQTQLNKPFQLMAPGTATVVPAILAPTQRAVAPVDEATANARRAQLINAGNAAAANQTNEQVMAQSPTVVSNAPSPTPASRPEIQPVHPPVGSVIPGIGTSLGPKAPLAGENTKPEDLTAQFRKQKSYEAWDASKPFYGGLKSVMADINKLTPEQQRNASQNLGIKDVELVSNFIKLYDPNAVIREFKWDKIEHSQPIPDRVRNWMSEITRSGSLTPETRQELYHVGTQAYQAKANAIIPDLQFAATRANATGLPLEQVLNPEEQSLLKAPMTLPANMGMKTPRGSDWGPVVNIPGKGPIQRGPDGQYHPAQ